MSGCTMAAPVVCRAEADSDVMACGIRECSRYATFRVRMYCVCGEYINTFPACGDHLSRVKEIATQIVASYEPSEG